MGKVKQGHQKSGKLKIALQKPEFKEKVSEKYHLASLPFPHCKLPKPWNSIDHVIQYFFLLTIAGV